jgi:hypothetical protein
VHAFSFATHHCVLKSAVPELCESLRFPDFLRSYYTATSHKPVEAFHSPTLFVLSVFGALSTSLLPRATFGISYMSEFFRIFSAVEFSTEQESCSCSHYFFIHVVLFLVYGSIII